MRLHEETELNGMRIAVRSICTEECVGCRSCAERVMLAGIFRRLRMEFPPVQRRFVLPLYGRMFRGIIPDPGYWVFAVDVSTEGRTVGIGTVQASLSPDALGLLTFVHVHPEFRRRGLARFITNLRCSLVRELGVETVLAEIEAVYPGCVISEGKIRRISAFNSQYWTPFISGRPCPHGDPYTGARYNLLVHGSDQPRLSAGDLEEKLFILYRIHYGLDSDSSARLASEARRGEMTWKRPMDLLEYR